MVWLAASDGQVRFFPRRGEDGADLVARRSPRVVVPSKACVLSSRLVGESLFCTQGFEESGEYLYHALLTINGQRVPGKTGAHLVRSPCVCGGMGADGVNQHAAHAAYGGAEVVQKEGYEVLCWRE